MTARSLLHERVPQAAIDHAWDHITTTHPLPATSAERAAWMRKHLPDLRAECDRILRGDTNPTPTLFDQEQIA